MVILAASNGWNESALLVAIRTVLNPKVLTELSFKNDDLYLDQLITLSICLDQLFQDRKTRKSNKKNGRDIIHAE